MPAKSYPFIDIAVHERVREHFARGDAAVLFSPDMNQVLWSNGEGAGLFGLPSIYDFIDTGANRGDAAYRQMEAAARQLERSGDRRSFLMRIASGFQRASVSASVEMITVRPGETAILFTAPRGGKPLSAEVRAARMISGFDDPDTHMAVLDGDGAILAASPGFDALAMTPQTCRSLVSAVSRDSDWLLKRPIPTGKGHLPAAIGKLSDSPALHLLFAVETILGTMDAGSDFEDAEEPAAIVAEAPPVEPASAVAATAAAVVPDDVIGGIGEIEEIEAENEDFAEEPAAEAAEPDTSNDAAPAQDAAVEDTQLAPLADVAPDEVLEPSGDDTADSTETVETVAEADEPVPDVLADTLSSSDQDGGVTASEADGSVSPAEESAAGETAIVESTTPELAATETEADVLDEVSAEEIEAEPDVLPDAATEDVIASDEAVSLEGGDIADDGVAVSGDKTTEIVAESTDAAAEVPSAPEQMAETAPLATSDTTPAEPVPATDGFVFNPNSRAIRFVWKIDADGRFSEISEEFATAVGPNAADVAGQPFTDLAERFHLDPDNTIGDLLKRRDTWSGKTILWPVEGTSLQVPVDLAALPTYSRNREFDGFRGFGIVRVADAVEDALALGHTLVSPAVAVEEPMAAGFDEPVVEATADHADTTEETLVSDNTSASEELTADEVISEAETTPEPADDQQSAEDAAAAQGSPEDEDPFAEFDRTRTASEIPPEDPFRGERPALKLVETQGRRASDKIVNLDHHRPQGAESLSRSEQAAFREIARQLGETFGKRPNDDVPAAEVPPVAEDPFDGIASKTPQKLDGDDFADLDTATSSAETEPDAIETTEDVVAENTVPAEATTETISAEPTAPVVPARTSSNSSLTGEMLDNLPLALLVHSGDELFHANSEFLALTGYADLDELREEGGIDALFAGDEDGLVDLPDGTMMVIRNDGHLVPVTARLQSIRWEDKSALMMALSAVHTPPVAAAVADRSEPAEIEPVSETDAAVEALRMETEELRSILETATDGVVVVGSEGEVRSLNRSASALFNYDDGEIRGKPFATLFAHESQKAVLDYLAGLSGHGVASVLNDGREVIGREASGGFIPLFMTMGRLSSSNGFCAVIRDITQWKRTEEELRNAKRAAETANAHKTDFLARVSHEIRTPLNAIIGFSDMMASEHFGPIGNARYVEYAGDIGRSGRHVLDIVNDLLDISKIEAGEMDLEFTSVEINDAVSEAVSLVQPQANSQRVIIRTSLSGSVPNVVADNRSIKQIALNILSNAIRFTPSGGQIVVSTAYEANGSVILRIRDTGVGMTRTELEQAMKPFRQVTTGARKRGDGTGLGLPLTKAMAEANRAHFSINSAPNEGTLVEISFPSQRVLAN
ncbi:MULTISPECIES: ATP-binding protein [unclassified Rhizobium]|uniref:ATP-binding protein n=1 Tax=unclassified Rhizobium TaxID=2613769 RepID=UPI00071332C9|nr:MULTISPECIES: ATP-binding protein [unclassified Rhizobium]KQS90989.1 PAS domain-containing sensor histidine kinase [Rhizobium sp. Leaf391]KQS96076.1 PAS domain-containing sensor histidine kinase [Rhizobium sp. Leaf386]